MVLASTCESGRCVASTFGSVMVSVTGLLFAELRGLSSVRDGFVQRSVRVVSGLGS